MSFQLSDYNFHLPDECIAQYPVEPRDHSRLMVLDRKNGGIEHRFFYHLPEYFGSQDLLVVNDSKVIPARLLGQRTGTGSGKVEVFLLEEKDSTHWNCLWQSRAKSQIGMTFSVASVQGEILQKYDDGTVLIRFSSSPLGVGQMPLPPYVKRSPDSGDDLSYQTVYHREPGSVAAPTAGLHFTPKLIETLKSQGVLWEQVTLHVGLGTFRPVKTEDIRQHQMHSERFFYNAGLPQRIRERRVTAVGTTSVRVLESLEKTEQGSTDIFIYPGYRFKNVDRMITNFHLPKSSLFMLVCAFAGTEFAKQAYTEAVENQYRFYSYGDAMLIL